MNIMQYENVMTPHGKNVITWCISMKQVIGLKQTIDIKNVTLGRVVRKQVNANPGLKVNRSLHFLV